MNRLTLGSGEAMTAIDYPALFEENIEETIESYEWLQLGAATARTTASAAGTDSAQMVVASTDDFTEGDYCETDDEGFDPVRILAIDPFTSTLYFYEARTWTLGAAVSERSAATATSPTGISDADGVVSGTPTVSGTYSRYFMRATTESGTTFDSPLLEIVVEAPPVDPPAAVGEIPSISVPVGSDPQVLDLNGYFTGANTLTIDPEIPETWSFVSGVLTVPATQVESFGPFTLIAHNESGIDVEHPTTFSSTIFGVSELRPGDGGTQRARARSRYIVEVNGQEYMVDSLEQAQRLAEPHEPTQEVGPAKMPAPKIRVQKGSPVPPRAPQPPPPDLSPLTRSAIEREYAQARTRAKPKVLPKHDRNDYLNLL